MKKFIALLLILIALMTFTSCNSNPGGLDNEDPNGGEIVDPNDGEDDNGYTDAEYAETFEAMERYVRSFIKEFTNKDQKLKTTYYSSGAEISYVSSHPEYVTHDGKYIKHEYDQEITLTCTIKWEGRTHVFDINFTSVGIEDILKLAKVKAWIEEYLENTELTDGTVLPTTHPNYGGRIRWVCEQPDVIVDYKTINLPTVSGTYRLVAEYTFNSPNAYEIVQYPVELKETTLSFEERVKNFLRQSLVSTEGEFFNLYNGTTPNINREYIIDIYDENIVSKLHSGIKPEISQSFLDEEVYEGYQVKNSDNVLWIVVHESGMNTTGVNAEYLAKAQHNYAYKGSSRDASWNYQVDDGEIYQSYEDNIYCHHASSRRGNSNSIGIEMCVNPDGEFNAAMRTDARLIGYLLRTYNLGMLNVKQHWDFAPDNKNCPENIRNDQRWFELMGMITREYASQELLSGVDVVYEIITEDVENWKLSGVYHAVGSKDIKVKVTVFGETFELNVTNE